MAISWRRNFFLASAAVLIFVVFSTSSVLINNSQVTATQSRTDLDSMGYNVLSRIVESHTIETTVESNPVQLTELKSFVQNALPSSVFFNLTVTNRSNLNQLNTLSVANADASSFANIADVSSTPMMYTSASGQIYSLILTLAETGGPQ